MNIGEDTRIGSPRSSIRPSSALGLDADSRDPKRLSDIGKLSLEQATGLTGDITEPPNPSVPVNPMKNTGGDAGPLDSPSKGSLPSGIPTFIRRTKALSGGPFSSKDPEYDRTGTQGKDSESSRNLIGHTKRLFDPTTDVSSPQARRQKQQDEGVLGGPKRVYDQRSHVFRTRRSSFGAKINPQSKADIHQSDLRTLQPNDRTLVSHSKDQDRIGSQGKSPPIDETEDAEEPEPDPELLLQPETRPISHDQLVVEVKGNTLCYNVLSMAADSPQGIYAGLVMVEAKCIDVDSKQSEASQGKTQVQKLTNEQWQALIALHKTLLHEHHDFFLASQHPSASPALSRLAAKYSMPARMWRHGIHAFLEVLRHRLPESLDHMLAFIYIAYSMMALLYETGKPLQSIVHI